MENIFCKIWVCIKHRTINISNDIMEFLLGEYCFEQKATNLGKDTHLRNIVLFKLESHIVKWSWFRLDKYFASSSNEFRSALYVFVLYTLACLSIKCSSPTNKDLKLKILEVCSMDRIHCVLG